MKPQWNKKQISYQSNKKSKVSKKFFEVKSKAPKI